MLLRGLTSTLDRRNIPGVLPLRCVQQKSQPAKDGMLLLQQRVLALYESRRSRDLDNNIQYCAQITLLLRSGGYPLEPCPVANNYQRSQ
jgi:hypothetical protein